MIFLMSCKKLFGVDAKMIGWVVLRRIRRLGLLRENGIQTLFVERERLSVEKKHLVRKELARVMDVEVDG